MPKNFGRKTEKFSKSVVNQRDGDERPQRMTINQDSILIQHQFDAGKSKLTQQIDMTMKAQVRMQHLMAMLKHKEAKFPLQLSDDESEEAKEDE